MITNKDVQYVAGLARIHLEENEIAPLAKELESILHYVDKLKGLDVGRVEPTSHALAIKNVTREDDVKESLSSHEVLNMAAAKDKGAFKVPKVIE